MSAFRDRRSLFQLMYIFFVVLIINIGLSRCSRKTEQTRKIPIVVSILPFAEFVERIGQDKVDVTVMVLPGASPHVYEPTPHQLTQVSKAKMYVKVGTPIEFELVWLDRIIAVNENMIICNAAQNIELITSAHTEAADHEHGADPHIWLSIQNTQVILDNICCSLKDLDPANKNFYEKNKKLYARELDSLDQYIKSVLAQKKVRKILVYHPSWGYFCRDYDLEQLSIEAHGKEPSAMIIKKTIDQARQNNIKVIFASLQFSTKSAQVIAREIGGKVILIDPLARDYIDNFNIIARQLAEAME